MSKQSYRKTNTAGWHLSSRKTKQMVSFLSTVQVDVLQTSHRISLCPAGVFGTINRTSLLSTESICLDPFISQPPCLTSSLPLHMTCLTLAQSKHNSSTTQCFLDQISPHPSPCARTLHTRMWSVSPSVCINCCGGGGAGWRVLDTHESTFCLACLAQISLHRWKRCP